MKFNLFKASMFAIFIVFILFLVVMLLTPALYIKSKTLMSVLLHNQEVYYALSLSLITSLISTLLATLISLPIGYVLARYEFRGKKLCDILLDLPIILPPLVMGLSLLILFGPVLGDYLAQVGIKFVFTPLGVLMAQFIVATPFTIRSFKTVFGEIDPVLEQAAMVLGDSYFAVFKRVTLPIARNGIISGITLAWARTMGEFGATVMLAGATRLRTETLPIAVFLNISTGDMDVAISISLIMVIFSIIIFSILKFFNHSLYDYQEVN